MLPLQNIRRRSGWRYRLVFVNFYSFTQKLISAALTMAEGCSLLQLAPVTSSPCLPYSFPLEAACLLRFVIYIISFKISMNVPSIQHVTVMPCVKIQLGLIYALVKKDIQEMASIVKVVECQFFLCFNSWLLRCKQE